MPMSIAEKVKLSFTSGCCKGVSINQLLKASFAAQTTTSALTLTFDSKPKTSVTLSLQYVQSSTGVSTSQAPVIYPSSITVTSNSSTLFYSCAVTSSSSTGYFTLQVTIGGTSSAEYNATYPAGKTLQILAAYEAPSTPLVLSSRFSSDGSYIILSFDSFTNRAGFSSAFTCTALFSFTGISTTSCLWQDAATVYLYPAYKTPTASSITILGVGSIIMLKSGTGLRAICPTGGNVTFCNKWPTVASVNITVQAPLSLQLPIVQVSAPNSITSCQSLTLDLTSSSGNAGRPWTVVIVATELSQAFYPATGINNFLSLNYTFSPPKAIPASLLVGGTTYSFTITLCNFLTACQSVTWQVVVTQSTNLVPIVSITGSNVLSTYRNFPIVVNSLAYTQSCLGVISYANLKYTWSVALQGIGVFNASVARSISQNPSTFRLQPYVLPAGNTYTLTLMVTSTTNTPTIASVSIIVNRGSIYAVINGGSKRIVRTGVVSTIDASGSYDQDQNGVTGLATGLSFSWSCFQISPVFNSTCIQTLNFIGSSSNTDKLSIKPLDFGAVNTTSRVTVIFYDATRSSQAYTDIFIISTDFNTISITTPPQLLTSFPTNQQLTISASMKLISPCYAQWNVDDPKITLSQISVTSTTGQYFSAGPNIPFNLRLAQNVLPQRSALLFSLSCGGVVSSVQVTTNGSPIPGLFDISPATGTELTTTFVLSASYWSDENLPITYQFGFIQSSTTLIIQSRSATTYSSNTMPAGSTSNGNIVNCSLQVFNAYNASSFSFNTVIVAPLAVTDQQAQLATLIAASTASGSIEAQKAVLAVATSVINSVNCTLAPNCTALHRSACLKTAHTCSSCLGGYAGEEGDKNTMCVTTSEISPKSSLNGTQCIVDSDCANSLQVCDNGICKYQLKQCTGNCSGNGECIFTYKSTGLRITSCRLNENTCDAFCLCRTNYTGDYCQTTNDALAATRALRSQLIANLQNLTVMDDLSKDSVESWSSYLEAVTTNPYELESSDSSKVQVIALTTVTQSKYLGVSYSSLTGVLLAVDAVETLSTSPSTSGTISQSSATGTPQSNSTAGPMLGVLNNFLDIVADSKIYGEPPTTYVYTNFRLISSTNHLSGDQSNNLTLNIPQTLLESLVADKQTSLSLGLSNITTSNSNLSSVAYTAHILQTYEKAYTNDFSLFYSDPVRLKLSSSDISLTTLTTSVFSELVLAIRSNDAISNFQFSNFTDEKYVTVCKKNQNKSYKYKCSKSGVYVYQNCTGIAGSYTTYCPKPIPTCDKLNATSASVSHLDSCVLLNFTTSWTYCKCTFITTNSVSLSGRRLTSTTGEIADATGVSDFVATSLYEAQDFKNTFNAANELNSASGAKQSVVIIALFCGMWGSGLLLFISINYREQFLFKERIKKRKGAEASLSEQMKDQILFYIESIVPSVYNLKESLAVRLFREIALHHMYFHVLVPDARRPSVLDRFYRTMKILSVQTMAMFIQAALFDLQNPSDDGTCKTFQTIQTCLSRKTVMDSRVTYCTWTPNSSGGGSCDYQDPSFSEQAVIYVVNTTQKPSLITAHCSLLHVSPSLYHSITTLCCLCMAYIYIHISLYGILWFICMHVLYVDHHHRDGHGLVQNTSEHLLEDMDLTCAGNKHVHAQPEESTPRDVLRGRGGRRRRRK